MKPAAILGWGGGGGDCRRQRHRVTSCSGRRGPCCSRVVRRPCARDAVDARESFHQPLAAGGRPARPAGAPSRIPPGAVRRPAGRGVAAVTERVGGSVGGGGDGERRTAGVRLQRWWRAGGGHGVQSGGGGLSSPRLMDSVRTVSPLDIRKLLTRTVSARIGTCLSADCRWKSYPNCCSDAISQFTATTRNAVRPTPQTSRGGAAPLRRPRQPNRHSAVYWARKSPLPAWPHPVRRPRYDAPRLIVNPVVAPRCWCAGQEGSSRAGSCVGPVAAFASLEGPTGRLSRASSWQSG